MRARSRSYKDIAAELGLNSPLEAKKCAEVGWGLAPGEDLRASRRRAADELDLIRRELWAIIDAKAYKVAANGTVPLDPESGQPLEDPDAKIQALRALTEVNKQYRVLMGTDAPKLSASVVASAPLEEIQAAVERMRAEVAQAEREALPGGAQTVPGDVLPDGL